MTSTPHTPAVGEPEREAPFKGPFYFEANGPRMSDVFDSNKHSVATCSNSGIAQWLCDRLNAPTLTSEERALYERCASRYPACSTADVGDLLAIISRLTTDRR